MRLPVSHIVVYQGCATCISEGTNAIKQTRPRAAPSFHTGCLVLVTGIKVPLCCIAFGPRAAGCTPLSHTIDDASTATTSNR